MSEGRILVVEDEEQLVRMMRSTLVYAGYEVEAVRSGREALEHLAGQDYDVVLLDLGLPDLDGQEVIRKARDISKASIIVISARNAETEKITALDQGANDYVQKPFDVGELLARIRVALRLRQGVGMAAVSSKRLEIDFERRRATLDGATIRLSGKEAELLRLLAEARGEVVSHDDIIDAIWGRAGGDADIMHLRVLTWQARRKIEPDPANPQFILAEPGIGYRLSLG
ncbi:MAG: response regulator transcription factor [Phenylobacterium sp.]|jgi:two-component system, OmpR family, KDP operon response regulator KdpE|uniref:response regulator transcription factor n=1 Tax=Phenylobacterium sp. TaxID=1871053 RepID=UPI003919DECC